MTVGLLLPVMISLMVGDGAFLPPNRQTPAPCVTREQIRVFPARPQAGTLFRLAVVGATASARSTVHANLRDARVAGEPLHFVVADDSITAWAAVPIDSGRRVSMTVPCFGTPATLAIVTRAATYPLERLRVAPTFSAPPDSALVARQQRESAMAAMVSRSAHETPPLWNAPFRAPRTSRITSGFGGGRTFNGTVTSRHMGIDYAGKVGAPVTASNRGVVRVVEQFFLGGNVVYLDHGAGFVTAYLHLSRTRVAVGDTVHAGMVIGDVGATGRVTGPHLHFIARYGTITIDPTSLMRVRE